MCASQHGMIHARQLRAIGLSQHGIRHRVRAGTLFEHLPLVYALTLRISEDGRRAAALLAVPGWSALSFSSGAELYRIAPRVGRVHHVVTTTRKRGVPGALHVHRTRATIPIRRIRGLAVVEPGRVLIDLATDLSGRPLEQAVGEALFHHLIPPDGLEAILTRYPGHSGAANLGAISAADAARRRTETGLEERVLMLLDQLPIPAPVCQYRLVGNSGRPYRADFAWPDRRVLLEADGRSAHERAEAMDSDRARDADLLAVGWLTLRVTGWQLRYDRGQFVASLLATLGVGV